jgi:hypothetical protein
MGNVIRILPQCQELKFIFRRSCLSFDMTADFDFICPKGPGDLRESQYLDILGSAFRT